MGSPRRLCDECSREPEQEIETQGRLRELFGCITWEGIVPKKNLRRVKLLQRHRFQEIAALADEMLTETDFQRQISLARREHEHEKLDELVQRYDAWLDSRTERLGDEISKRF